MRNPDGTLTKKALISTIGEGRELNDLLRARLGIPDSAKWYEIRVAAGEVITVTTEYIALEKGGDA